MTTVQAADYAKQNGCILMRARKDTAHEWDVKEITTGGKTRGWFYLDIQTANLLCTIYAALSDEHKAKFNRIPLGRLVDFCWKQVKAA